MTSLIAFVLVLGALVFVHELGHFLVARLHGVRCLTFSLGLGPKLLQTKRGDTVYCISAIPLGGYVKMAGEKPHDQPDYVGDEFLAKTKWQQFQILLAGPAMNILLAVVVMTVVVAQGSEVPTFEAAPPVVGSVGENSSAAAAGIVVGDRILTVAGREVDTWEELTYVVGARADREIEVVVQRADNVRTVRVTPAGRTKYNIGEIGVGPVMQPQVIAVSSSAASVGPSAAQAAGVLAGDVIEAASGRDVTMASLIETLQASPGRPISLRIRRDDANRDLVVTPQLVDGVGVIGVQLRPFEAQVVAPGVIDAVGLSLQQNYVWSVLVFQTIQDLLARDISPTQLVGPIGIGQLSGSAVQVGWIALLSFAAMISLNLGLMNLLPVPILDGGHILILAMEGISRREFGVQLKQRLRLAGMAVLLVLVGVATYNDLSRIEWLGRLLG